MIIICKLFNCQVTILNTNYLHIVIWFQVLQSNTNNFQTSILPIDGTLTGTTTLGKSGPRSNGNEEVTP